MFITIEIDGKKEDLRSWAILISILHTMPKGTAYSVKYAGHPEYNGVACGAVPVEVFLLIDTFYKEQQIAIRNHPELLPGEEFAGNTQDTVEQVQRRHPGWKNVRLGSQAYYIDLLPIPIEDGYRPIFIKK